MRGGAWCEDKLVRGARWYETEPKTETEIETETKTETKAASLPQLHHL